MKIGDKVYVSNWLQRYLSVYTWVDGKEQLVFPWTKEIPKYSDYQFFIKVITEPNLTLKGTVNKKEPTKVIDRIPIYKNFEYTIEEIVSHPTSGNNVCLLSSKEGCWVQMSEKGLSTLTPEDQEKIKHLETEKRLQALAKDNLGKWTVETAKHDTVPEELIKTLYDTNQNVLFGSTMTKGIVTYTYLPKDYTVNGNDLYLGGSVNYNGEGCDLTGKETTTWEKLKKRFPENV